MTVFIVVGIVTYNFPSWIQQNARYATIVIAVGLIGLGIAMLGRSVGLACRDSTSAGVIAVSVNVPVWRGIRSCLIGVHDWSFLADADHSSK